jgi:hypothetical protein
MMVTDGQGIALDVAMVEDATRGFNNDNEWGAHKSSGAGCKHPSI